MRDIPIREVVFSGLRNCVVNRQGEVVDTLTDHELAELHAVNGRPPARIADAWVKNEVCVIGGSPNYGKSSAGFLDEGELCDRGMFYEIGYHQKVREGVFRRAKLQVRKTDVTTSRGGGLTLTKRTETAWDEAKTGVIAIDRGTMTVAE